MSCIRVSKTNGNQSILFDKLYEIYKSEELADKAYAYFDEPLFIEAFGDYKNIELDVSRIDENGEPALFYDNRLNKYFYLDKFNQKVYYPENIGLNQYLTNNDIKLFAKTIALKFYENHVNFDYDSLSFKVDKSIKKFTEDFLQNKIDELTFSSNLNHVSKGIALSMTTDLVNDWINEVKDYYASLKTNYKSTEEVGDEIIEEEVTTRDDLMRKESFTVSQKDNINNNIKLFLSLLKSDKLNDFNEYNFISFDDIYSTLNKTLNNTVAIYENNESLFDKFKEKVGELVNVKPHFKALYDRLNNSEITDSFKNQFTSAFNLYKKNYLVSEVSKDDDGNIIYVVKNLTESGSRKRTLLSNWDFTYKKILENKHSVALQKVKNLQLKLNRDSSKIKDIEPYIDDLKKALDAVGVTYTTDAINYLRNDMSLTKKNTIKEDIQFLKSSYSAIVRGINYAKDNATKKESMFEYQSSFYGKLAESIAFFQEEGTDASVFTMGKTKWFYSNPSYLDFKIEEWKNNPQELINHYESTTYNKGSHWLEYLTAAEIENIDERIEESRKRLSKVKVGIFNNVQDANDSLNGFDNKNIGYTDSLIDYMNKVLAFKKGADVYHKTALAADKSTEYQIFYGSDTNYFGISSGLEYANNKFNVSDEVLDIFYKYFKAEYYRINEVYEQLQTGENLIPNYHIGRANGLKSQLIPSLSDNKVITLYDANGKPLYTDLDQIKNDIKEHINNKLHDLIVENYNLLLNNQVFKYNESGERINNLLDSSIYNNYKESVSNKNQIYHTVAADMVINSIISQVEFSKMFTGDIAYYKDIIDYKKRVPETYTDGKYLTNLNSNELYFNAAVINSVEIGYQDMKSLEKYLDEDIYNYYKDSINDTDAQAWITPERWLFIMDKLGKKNDTVTNLYKKMTSGKKEIFDSKELKLLAQPLKGVYFDIVNGKPVYLKYSQAVLSPNLVKGTKLETLYNKMKDNNVDELVTRDGVKVGYPIPTTTHNENGSVKDDFDMSQSIMRLTNSKWKLQQDLPTKGIKQTPIGSQIQKNIYQGLINDNLSKEFYTSDESFTGSELIQEINDVVGALSNHGLNVVKDKLGLDDNFNITNEDKLYSAIIEQLEKRADANPNIIKALKAGTSPYGIPGGLNIFQNIFSTIINKNIVKISTNGAGYIQMANYGINASEAANQNIIYAPWHDKDHLPMPELYTDENGKKRLKPAGIFISGSFLAKVVPNYKTIPPEILFGTAENNYTDGIIDKEILENVIGYRIPNQGLASNDALQILGILPEETGDTVIAYTGITKKTGSDFDIDKMYLMTPSFTVEYEDYVKSDDYVYENLKGKTIKDTINNILDLLDKIDPKGDLINVNTQQLSELIFKSPDELGNLVDLMKFYIDELNYAIRDYSGTDADLIKLRDELLKTRVSKLRYSKYDSTIPSSEQHPKMLQNRLIELYQSVLTSTHTANQTFNPIDLDIIENNIKSMLPIEEKIDFQDLNAIADLKLKNEFRLGKAGLGQNVNSLVDSVRGAMADLKINNSDYALGMGLVNDNGETIFDEKNSESLTDKELTDYVTTYNEYVRKYNKLNPDNKKQLITKKYAQEKLASINLNTSMMTLVNGFVDIAKDSYITKGNWVTQTNNVGFMLLRAGVHPFKINALLNQPIIKDYILFRANMESNSIKDTSNLFAKFLLNRVYKNVESTFGDNTITINDKKFTYNNIFKSILTPEIIISNHNAISNRDNNTNEYNRLVKDVKTKLISKFELTKDEIASSEELQEELTLLTETIMQAHDEMFKPYKDRYSSLDLSTLRKEILEESNSDNQLFYLKYFTDLTKAARKLTKNVSASKVDVEGKGKNITSLIINNNIIKNILSKENIDGELGGFRTKFYWNGNKTILKTYIDNSLGFSYEIMKNNPKYFLAANENVIRTFNRISQFIYDNNLENEKLATLLEKTYTTYAMSGFPALYADRKTKADLLNNIPSEILALKESKKYKDNVLLQELYLNTNKKGDFIAMSNVKKSLSFKNDITDGWRQLLEDEPVIAEKLIKYSYLISGFNNSATQFHEYIPYEWFNRNRFNSYLIQLANQLDGIDFNFINQFFRHNLDNLSLSKEVYNNQLEYKSPGVVILKNSEVEGVTPPYIIRRRVTADIMTGKTTLLFYKLEDYGGINLGNNVEKNGVVYTRVEKMGYKDSSNNRYVEYNNRVPYKNDTPLPSIVPDNKIKGNINNDLIKQFRQIHDPAHLSSAPEVLTEEDKSTPEFDLLPSQTETPTMTYAGIGSRTTPAEILDEMTEVAEMLEEYGFTLNTGVSFRKKREGADAAFEKGATTVNLFSPEKHGVRTREQKIAKEIHPAPQYLKQGGLKLMARNTNQVFGDNLNRPVDFVIFYAKETKSIRPEGGTGQAVEMARRKGIPTINMADANWREQLDNVLSNIYNLTDNLSSDDAKNVTINTNKWTKDSPKENPNTAYVFTENINSIGSNRVGGGSAVIRNNPNAIGIVTKKYYIYKENRNKTINVYWGQAESETSTKILSNLAPRKFTWENKEYGSVEHAYQSNKSGTFDQATYEKYNKIGGYGKKIRGKGTIAEMKAADSLGLMKKLVIESFKQNPNSEAAKKLMQYENFTHNSNQLIDQAFLEGLKLAQKQLTNGSDMYNQNFQDTESDFEMFKKINLKQFDKIDKFNNVIFPDSFANSLASIPNRFALWLQNELKSRYGLVTELNEKGTGLISKSIESSNKSFPEIIWNQHKDIILKKYPKATLELMEKIYSEFGKRAIDDYINKCYR